MPQLPTNGRGQVTDRTIEEIPFSPKQVLMWHPSLPGFGVLVGKSAKSYVAQAKITVSGRKRDRRITIGNTDVWRLADAEARARDLIMQMQAGVDPRAEARDAAEREANVWTLRKMIDHARRAKRKPEYAKELERWCADWLDLSHGQITGRKVHDRYLKIIADMQAKGKSGISTANDVMKYLSAVWNSVNRLDEELGRNPVAALKGTKLATPAKADRIPEDKLCGFWDYIWDEPFISGRDVVIFMLLTGLRREVACGFRAEWWDSESRMMRIPGAAMKMGKDFVAPVSQEVAGLMDRRLGICRGGVYLFEGKAHGRGKRRKPGGDFVKEPRYILDRVRAKLDFECSVHGLRRTFSSEAAMCIGEVPRKMLMGHAAGGDITMRHYTSIGSESLRADAQAVTDRIIGYASDPKETSRRVIDGVRPVMDSVQKREAGYDKMRMVQMDRANAEWIALENEMGSDAFWQMLKDSRKLNE